MVILALMQSLQFLEMRLKPKSALLLLMVVVVSYMSVKLVYVAWELESIRGQQFLDSTIASCVIFPNVSNLSGQEQVVPAFNPSFPEFVHVDCKAIFEDDEASISKAKKLKVERYTNLFKDQTIEKQAHNCKQFRDYYGYNSIPNTKEETDFPIAYSIVFYKDVAQINILLRSIYRPQNFYCLHLDSYAPDSVRNAVKSLVACFNNVFLASRLEYVTYAGFSRLQADINCMTDLLSKKRKWNYFINLPGQEFPLKTNLEIVKILKIYNGSNDIEGITGKRMLPLRYKYKYKYIPVKNGRTVLVRTDQLKSAPPHNITIVKGSAYGVFSRKFVQFVIKSEISQDFLQWCKDISSPDEYFWATLNHNTHLEIPGGYSGQPDKKAWLATYAGWGGVDPCHGKFVHGVCIFGVGDLPLLMTKKELFANKFYLDFQPAGLHCMEQWIRNKTTASIPFSTGPYRSLPFVNKKSN